MGNTYQEDEEKQFHIYCRYSCIIPVTGTWSDNPPPLPSSAPVHTKPTADAGRAVLLRSTPTQRSEWGRAFQFTAHSPPPSLKLKLHLAVVEEGGDVIDGQDLNRALLQWGNWIIRQMGFANARGSERSQNEPLSLPRPGWHLVCRQPFGISTFSKVKLQQGSGRLLLKKKCKHVRSIFIILQ